ncbi:MAG TPA: DUF2092 domain-containing protein [Candidatus Methylomirabilis sp.]|nr:DUF2092 domain-containing protein [Candidatus Methylomirabilis sp.]
MVRVRLLGRALLFAAVILLAAHANAQQPPPAAEPAKAPSAAALPTAEPALEPKAIDILQASSRRLAAARSMTFTAVVSYESPSRLGPALVYTTRSQVTLQRPDKLRVIQSGDGPVSEFYYDGKTMVAFAPAENLVAIAAAPPTIDAALEAAYASAAIYFPFADVMVADPYGDIAKDLELAFYIGQSGVVAGTKTDIVAYASHGVFVQMWVGADDKLPRMARAVFRNDPLRLRHQVDFADWKLGGAISAKAFASSSAAKAQRIPFAHPDPKPSSEATLPPAGQPLKTQ